MAIDPPKQGRTRRTNLSFDSGLLQALARDYAELCDGYGDFDAITTAVMSALAFEAFINEVEQLARTMIVSDDEDAFPGVMAFDPAALKIIDCLRGTDRPTTLDRYDLFWKAVTGQDVDDGRDPKQALKIVFSVRDAIAHLKSQQTEIRRELREDEESPSRLYVGPFVEYHPQPNFMRSLEARNLLSPWAGPSNQWSLRISSGTFANWVCETVEHTSKDLVLQFPDGSLMRDRLMRDSLAGFSNDRRQRRHLRRSKPEAPPK